MSSRRTGQRARFRQVADVFEVPDVPDPGEPAELAELVAPETRLEVPDVVAEGDVVSGRSADLMVEATVDARGVLCDLRIDPRVFRGPHPRLLGRLVVEAVADARAGMLRAARERHA